MRRLVLPIFLALAALAAAENERLAGRSAEFLDRGWGSRDHLMAGDAEDAATFLAALADEFPAAELTPEERLDLRLMRHRLEGLLEAWRDLDLEHRDVFAWLPGPGEVDSTLAASATDPSRGQALLDSIEDSSRRARAALEHVDREDAAAGNAALDDLAKHLEEDLRRFPPARPGPAFTELRRFLSERKNLADARKPGRARDLKFREYVRYFRWDVGVDEDPKAIFELGKRLFAETLAQLETVAKRIDPSMTWREIADDLRLHHPTAEGLLEACRAEMNKATAFAKKEDFVTIPDWATHVRADWGGPDDHTPYGHYNPCNPGDPDLKGVYVVSPVTGLKPDEQEQVLRGNNYAWIRVVSLHEAIPGHHLQFAIAARRTRAIPKYFYNPSYVEGWGLYCEELMFRHGYYDDRTRLSQLKMRLWRCARIVIDVGCQLGGMTKEEGVRLLVEAVGMEKPSAEMEVARYIASPGYYSGYILGKDRFERMYLEEKERLGSRFDEKHFHDRLLQLGPLPFRVIEEAIKEE